MIKMTRFYDWSLINQIKQIMKTLQNLTQYRFTERTIVIGDKAIHTIIMVAAFAFLILPFLLMIARLS